MRKIIYEEASDGIFIDRVVRDYEFTMPSKHFHEEYEIYYLVKGERNYFIDTKSYHVKEGSLVFINKNTIHKTGQYGSSYHDRINIELSNQPYSSFLETTNEIKLNKFFAKYQGVLELNPKEQNYVRKLFGSIAYEICNKSACYHMYIMCRLAELLIFAKRKMDTLSKIQSSKADAASSTFQKVSEVASYISENYDSECSLKSLAERFYINKSYLSRIFKETTGYTITEYINISRIQASIKLLSETNLAINEVALMVGYESITYFERVFQKVTETTPLKYRKLFLINNPEARAKTYKAEKL